MVDPPVDSSAGACRKAQQFRSNRIRDPQDVVLAPHALHNILWNEPCVLGLLGLLDSVRVSNMAKRQTRRSISVKGITYQRLKNFCEEQSLSVSGYLEDIIAAKLDAANVPVPERVDPRPKPKASGEPEEIVSQHFTF
jgi:hypothetical protein